MKTYKLKTRYKKLLADTVTPVSIYLKIRDKFANSILLESSDYHGTENSISYICIKPIARFEVANDSINTQFPDGTKTKTAIEQKGQVIHELNQFRNRFETEEGEFNFSNNGLFGYIAFDAVRYFEDVEIKTYSSEERNIPDILYQVYQYVIVINHFKEELYIFEHSYGDEEESIHLIETLINNKNFASYRFYPGNDEVSNFNDEEFLQIIQKGIDHCHRGDVFQMVLSRRFSQSFKGDEFNVYRALRSINPSPYLFYFDYGNFKIFGSSPEAQIVIKDRKATIYPIAGTFKRTGNDQQDAELAKKLFDDPKENSEHVMLVDLARNDLSRSGKDVTVETFKEIQYYSHVIHLVSKVTGELEDSTSSLNLVADTFPAGTLSGAPKHSAMTLINKYEKGNRGFYGGAIGFLGFNGDFNHAIIIRSLLSRNNKLFYQAGAGVVAKSNTQSELNEVHNKLLALRKSFEIASEIK
ncbi:anthranilate synthase component I family protein [Cytophagaceae bacterium ABcell3]|nr:anthranilate synthase component I family protein [Cytophagaceae bacterium ABcell3]